MTKAINLAITECKFPDKLKKSEVIPCSKAFDTMDHDLLLAKLWAYGFSSNALNLMCSYLKNWKQRTQINNNFSSEKKVIAGVPQGSIDGPFFINDLIFL